MHKLHEKRVFKYRKRGYTVLTERNFKLFVYKVYAMKKYFLKIGF